MARQRLEKKRVKGIEPSPKAWEAFILPLNYTRVAALKVAGTFARVKTDEWIEDRTLLMSGLRLPFGRTESQFDVAGLAS